MANTAKEQGRTVRLPGFGLPIDTFPPSTLPPDGKRARFPHAIADECHSTGVTLRERRMLDFINKITDKPEWERKIFDEIIVDKWRGEACVWNAELDDIYLSSTMFDNCIEELRDKAAYYQESGLVLVWDSEIAVVKSDRAVSPELADSLQKGVHVLENVPDYAKDWHPYSGERVLDLLHPSLFPLIFGRSKALPSGTVPLDGCNRLIGAGEVVDPPLDGDERSLKPWGSFQWLPSDICFAEDGSPQIISYINNLPHDNEYKHLYGILEKFVAAAIPLWNETLSWFEPRLRFENCGGRSEDWKEPEGITFPGVREDEDDAYYDWFSQNKVLAQIEPEPFQSRQLWESKPEHKPVDLRKDFHDSGLQVIFKLSNIHLTPEDPEYYGGSWHIEGALNEHICASALYYYDQENVEESGLAFRQSLDPDEMSMRCEQNAYDSMEIYYGLKHEEAAIQELGKVHTRPGRLLAFPNTLQHEVQPFKLIDPSKPGHRKILAMFLVDPHIRVLSTANIPPQRKEWWIPEILKLPPFNALPREIFDMIMGFVLDFPMSWEEAEDVREELMDERGAQSDDKNNEMEQETFYFCEH